MRLLVDEHEATAKLARLMNREKAREIALHAHDGQQDKAGRSYIAHVVRVAFAVSDDPMAETVAWLHDVIEDNPGFETELVATFPEPVLVAVRLLTRNKDTPAEDYYRAIAGNPIALRVKLADVADNSDESRLCLLSDEVSSRLRVKYAKAMAMLQSGAGAGEVVIDLDAEFAQRMREAVAQQTWMVAEYMANDWQADILDFLRNGPSTFA